MIGQQSASHNMILAGGRKGIGMKKTTTGFTIIEVVLVLAIAGLIFLMVFLALPALQRQQRDTQRRSDASRVATNLTNWKSNNNGQLPLAANEASFVTSYLKAATEFKSPATQATYAISWVRTAADATTANASTNADAAFFGIGFNCSGETLVAAAGKFGIRIPLENGGGYCVGDN